MSDEQGTPQLGEPSGVCPVCGKTTGLTQRRKAIAAHYPDDVQDAHNESEGFYCRGSDLLPKDTP